MPGMRLCRIVWPFLLCMATPVAAEAPVLGKYRCYQPPNYEVVAWLELREDVARINGDDPQPYTFDAAASRFDWPDQSLAPYRHGILFLSGMPGDDTGRTTILLTTKPGQRSGAKLPRCYLTTH